MNDFARDIQISLILKTGLMADTQKLVNLPKQTMSWKFLPWELIARQKKSLSKLMKLDSRYNTILIFFTIFHTTACGRRSDLANILVGC